MDTFHLTKEQALRLYRKPAELARALKITRSAVSQWKPGERIPEEHALKIRFVLKPDAFDKKGRLLRAFQLPDHA